MKVDYTTVKYCEKCGKKLGSTYYSIGLIFVCENCYLEYIGGNNGGI